MNFQHLNMHFNKYSLEGMITYADQFVNNFQNRGSINRTQIPFTYCT